jgi:hypothetical protein
VAASYATARLSSHLPPNLVQAQAAVHSYQVVFWICAGIFAAGAVACIAMQRSGAQQADSEAPEAAPGI